MKLLCCGKLVFAYANRQFREMLPGSSCMEAMQLTLHSLHAMLITHSLFLLKIYTSRVTRGKTPWFSAKYFFSQKLSEIFKFCKVHILAKLLGHILTFKKILFHIWELSYPNICSRKKISCPVSGARRHPLRGKTPTRGVIPLFIIYIACIFFCNGKYNK